MKKIACLIFCFLAVSAVAAIPATHWLSFSTNSDAPTASWYVRLASDNGDSATDYKSQISELPLDAGQVTTGTLPITRGGTGATSLAANAVPRSTGSALVAGVMTDDGTNVINSGKYTDGDGDTAIDLEESADDDTIRFDAGGTEVMRVNGGAVTIVSTGGDLGLALDSTSGAGTYEGLSLRSNGTAYGYHCIDGSSAYIGHTSKISFRVGSGSMAAGTDAIAVDASAVAGNTRFMIYDVDNGTLERVTVGAADSGGSGYKVLRIPN